MELTKKMVMGYENTGTAGTTIFGVVMIGFAGVGVFIQIQNEFTTASVIGYIIAALLVLGGIKLITNVLKNNQAIRETYEQAWYYKTYEVIGTDRITFDDSPDNFYVIFKDAEHEHKVQCNDLNGKIDKGDTLIYVVSPANDQENPSKYGGAWYFSGREYHISANSTDFVYRDNLIPAK